VAFFRLRLTLLGCASAVHVLAELGVSAGRRQRLVSHSRVVSWLGHEQIQTDALLARVVVVVS